MARPPDRAADPVRINQGPRVVWYPSGFAGVGRRTSKRLRTDAEAEAFARAKRLELQAVRALHRQPRCNEPGPDATVEDSVGAWLADLDRIGEKGTATTYRSRANRVLASIGGNRCLELNERLWKEPLRRAAADGLAMNTFDGIVGCMRAWRRWARQEGWLPAHVLSDGETLGAAEREQRELLRRKRANLRAVDSLPISRTADGPADDDGDSDRGIRVTDVPAWGAVDAFADAIHRRESGHALPRPQQGRGTAGGTPRLSKGEAWRLSEAPRVQAATGLRMCELLSLHSKDVNLGTGTIKVERQLDRYEVWLDGEAPPVTAPKHGKTRETQAFTFYLPTLAELCAYANEHHDGWIMPPTRQQRHWADAFYAALKRGRELLEWERANNTGSGIRWAWSFHWLRHHYGSYALAPTEAGGYGWSVAYTSARMGHSSPTVTQGIYQHPVDGDDQHARQSSSRPPGLQ